VIIIMVEVGIDLAGVKTRQTGFAILDGMEAKTKVFYSDRAIIKAVEKSNVGSFSWNKCSVVSIDAPLSNPLHGRMRVCERNLLKMGIKVFPCLFTQMAKLTERGIKLAQSLRKMGYLVIESYPGSAQDILGIPRKGKSLKALQEGLVKYGITGDVTKYGVTDHELDAITSAIVGKLYLEGKTIALGNEKEGLMIIPKQNAILDTFNKSCG